MPLPRRFLDRCRRLLEPAAILSDPEEMAPFEEDFWRQNRGRAALVLLPSNASQVAALLRFAAEDRVPIVPQSGNTGLTAGGIPDASGREVVLSLRRLARIRHTDPAGEYLVAEAGCVLADVQKAAAAIGREFPLRLGSEGSCRIGGNLSTNAGGVHVLRHGMARSLVLGLEVALADGRLWNGLKGLTKDNSGYDLKQLFIGSEGTLGVITAATLRLVAKPRERATCWLAIGDAADAVALLRRFRDRFGELLASFELLSGRGVEITLAHIPGLRPPVAGRAAWHLLIELAWSLRDGLGSLLEELLEELLAEGLVLDGTVAGSEAQRGMLWRIREEQTEAAVRHGEVLRNDISVEVARIPELIRKMESHVAAAMPEVEPIPFGHVGDGNLHFNFVLPRNFPAAERRKLQDRLVEEVMRLGGSFSAEHGIGRLKVDQLLRFKSEVELDLMRRLKKLLDPRGVLNPGAVLPAAEH